MSLVGWDGLVTVTVEVALSAATSTYGLWNAGIWDTSTWGPDVAFTDVSSYVRGWSTDRAFSRGVEGWNAGTATIVLNNRDGRFSPANLSGPYVSGGVTQVRPLRPIRIRAAYNSVTYDVYRGYVLDFVESFVPAGPEKGDAIVTLPCSDEFVRLAAVDGMEVAAVGASELSGARVHRVLNAAGHTGERNIDVGENTLQATTLADATLTELENIIKAEGGAFWVDAAGKTTFDGQYALIENDRSITSQATFGDESGISYSDAEVVYGYDLVINSAAYTREGGTVQTASDATSQALYGPRRDTETSLICETDAQALSLAQWKVTQYKDPEYRFKSITIHPRKAPATMWPQALGREVRDLITVVRNPPGGHEINRACHIAGISHDVPSSAQWTTTFALWSATPYVAYAGSRWDQGIWGESLWFF